MATIASRYFNVQVEQYQRRKSKKNLAVQGELTAPMPAKVIDVLVRPGEVVTAGQPLILLESMKMQMEVKSPTNGMIEAVFVQAAAQVEKGARLVSIQNENPRIS
jgi:biotin carboxyl carrier protein